VVTDVGTYRTELAARIGLIGDDIAWAIRGIDGAAEHYRPADGDWSVHEHLAHLRDMEQEVYLPLLRWATVPDMLDPKDYSRRDWHERRYRPGEPLAAIYTDFSRMRDEALSIFREMDDATWTRWREETRWGPLTCEWIAELMYRHALDHLQCLMALRQDMDLERNRPGASSSGSFARRP
jgi:hypothetical protein